MIAAALLAAAVAAAEEPASVRAFALLERAQAALSSDACPSGVSAESVFAELDAGALTPAAAGALDAGRDELRLLYSCRAAAAGSPAPCAAVAARPARVEFAPGRPRPAGRPQTLGFYCESDLQDLSMVKARAAGDGAAFVKACLGHDAAGHRDFVKGKTAEACAILADASLPPAQACAKLAPLYSSGLPGEYCAGELAYFSGDAARCEGLKDQAADRELCLAAAAYVKGDCGGSAVCAALRSGDASACAAHERRALAGVCRAQHLPRLLEEALRALDAGESALAAPALGRAAAAAQDAEAEALVRARLRADALRAALRAQAQPPASLDDPALLEERLSALEGARGSGKACRAAATPALVKGLLLDPETSEATRGVLLTAARPWLERLYNAEAMAAGSPDPCDELAPLKETVRREKDAGDIPLDLLCKTNYYEALLARSVISGGPEVFELCRKRNLIGDRDFKLDSLDVSCRIIAEKGLTVAETCGKLTPYFDNATIGGTCPRMLRFASGDETVCPLFTDPMVKERCAGYSAFKSGKKGRCEKEAHCQLITGGVEKARARAAEGLAAAACGVLARAEVRAELGGRLAAQASAAAGRLAQSVAAEGRSASAAADAAVERAARRQARALALLAP